MGIVEPLEGEAELGSGTAPDPKAKVKEHTAAMEGVSHTPAPALPAEAPAVPAQQISRPSPFRGPRFSAKDMAEAEGSGLKRRVTPMKSKPTLAPLQDDPDNDWSDELKAKYRQVGVQMVLGGWVTQNVRAMVKRVLELEFCEGVTPEQGLVNFIFRGQYTQGLDSQFFMNCRQSGPAVYPTWADVWTQEGLHWTPQERLDGQARAAVSPGQADFDSLVVGSELTEEELQQFARGLVVIAGYVSAFPIDPPLLADWLPEHRQAHQVRKEYRLTLLRYVVTLARFIMDGNCKLIANDYKQHRLLVEFYWMLHKIHDFLLKTDADGCAESCSFLGERVAGMRELWEVMGGLKCAGVQTLQRRMMLQLGQLERDGCSRLDQVWSRVPSQDELLAAIAGAIESLKQDLSRPPADVLERALHLNEEIDEAIEAMRKKVTPTKSKKERSPSEESLELLGTERTKGKGVEETQPHKRAKEEQSAVKGAEQKTPRKTVATPKPYYRLVTSDQWEKNKQNEGTYRLDHAAWRGE
jgi:hypothetical protein